MPPLAALGSRFLQDSIWQRICRAGAALLEGPVETRAAPAPSTPAAPRVPSPPKSQRSEAITLLATLQREARFVDLVQEPLGDFSDEQIGAAARDVLRACGEVLRRTFDLQPVVDEAENSVVETPASPAAGRYRLTGNVVGEPPFRGRLVHHGWEARKCELPTWSGEAKTSRVVSPAEVEL